jgi:hypothetical protein
VNFVASSTLIWKCAFGVIDRAPTVSSKPAEKSKWVIRAGNYHTIMHPDGSTAYVNA